MLHFSIIFPSKVDPMIETALIFWPIFNSPRASRTAILAESAVPVGERSTLPGLIETADLKVTQSAA